MRWLAGLIVGVLFWVIGALLVIGPIWLLQLVLNHGRWM
jgi:hypothetical protein